MQAYGVFLAVLYNGVEYITNTPPPENANIHYRMHDRRNTPEEIKKHEAARKIKEQERQINRRPTSDNSRDSEYEAKRKELAENYNKAMREYNEEKKRRESSVFNKQPSAREKELRDKMFKAQEEEHSFVFSPENIEKGRVYEQTTTIKIKRGK